MTGKEAIIHYLGTHNSFCAPDVAALTGATVTSINQAAAKMARAGLLVIEGKVWRTVYYRFATKEEREGKMSTNLIFKECRQSAAMKRVLAVYSAAIFLIPICISFDTAEKRRYATYLILNRRFSFEF
ncbi:protein ren [Escherichia coli]|nr:protein ren [Escherichia coli]